MREFVEILDDETVNMVKNRVIEAIGKENYYELIGDRVEFIFRLKKDVHKHMENAISDAKRYFNVHDIDEKRAWRLVVLNEANDVVRENSNQECEEFYAVETALMTLALEVYEGL